MFVPDTATDGRALHEKVDAQYREHRAGQDEEGME
jgi:hypothetical protein